jgi:hypothetical protein
LDNLLVVLVDSQVIQELDRLQVGLMVDSDIQNILLAPLAVVHSHQAVEYHTLQLLDIVVRLSQRQEVFHLSRCRSLEFEMVLA